ncbi:MAG: hypothetical protein DSZ21_00945, partial [Tenericutes bacterium]
KSNIDFKRRIKTFKKYPAIEGEIMFIDEYKNYKKENKYTLTKRHFYRSIVRDVMEKVSLSPKCIKRYPEELSDVQAQEIVLARALIMNPEIIIADEPFSILDISSQAKVINLLKNLVKEDNLSLLFIAHNLEVVRYIADRVIIMQNGKIIEEGSIKKVYKNPTHPYTKSLINSIPSLDNPLKIRNYKSNIPSEVNDFMNLGLSKKE